MLNRVVLVGRLTKDPDLKYTPNGVAVANFTLAVNRSFSNQAGEKEADFINCVVWRRPAENLANFMGKGSLVGVDGRVQTRSFDNQEGKKVYVTEIVADSVQFLDTKGGQSANQGNGRSNNNSSQSSNSGYDQDPFRDKGDPINIADDDLPF
ncbi:single-stranded DNA-binding protein [Terribacillus saccharophilus]|uniref:single-stranded DNA-binding protein n=1 Tax=Terribacillus saccharophilus TaxID=361277 RepID=UPI003D2A7F1E